MTAKDSLLLLSGGLDSSCIAAWRAPRLCLTINYGQAAAAAEISASREICRLLDLEHAVVEVDCRALGEGTLAGSAKSEHSEWEEFWPYRNQLLVTFAAAIALKSGLATVLCGSISTDDRHVDGTAGFYAKANELVRMQEGGVSVAAPAIELTCHDLIAESGVSDEVLANTHSCHVSPYACGNCAGCIKRTGALAAAGRLQ